MSSSNKTAEKFKTKGNKAFASEDYDEAIKLYSSAIQHDSTKAFASEDYDEAIKLYSSAIQHDSTKANYFTNRALARLKSSKAEQQYDLIAKDAEKALELTPDNSKAFFYLGIALTKLDNPELALKKLNKAYQLALETSNKSAQQISEQILETRKEIAKKEFNERISRTNPLYEKLYRLLQEFYWSKINYLRSRFNYKPFYEDDIDFQIEYKSLKDQYIRDLDDLRHTFEASLAKDRAPPAKEEAPEYILDPIGFNIFNDPVVTPSGFTYERSWIVEHLKTSPADPFTRAPLRESDLYPNLAVKKAADKYIEEHRHL